MRPRSFPIVLAALSLSGTLHAQWFDWSLYSINFDDTLVSHVQIDTTDGHGGLWQIGAPQKSVLTSAQSAPNVIVTDTLAPYPPNDTSRFTIVHLANEGWWFPHTVILEGYYWSDTDSLEDIGTIEVAYNVDSGWIDVLHDTLFAPMIIWGGGPPQLTGSSGGWRYFYGDLMNVSAYIHYGIGYDIQIGDTIRWRFSFFSDSTDTGRDGLMFDDLHFEDWAEAIPEYSANSFHSQVAPTPVTDELTLIYETAGLNALALTIVDARGTVVRSRSFHTEHRTTIDVHDLSPGLYLYALRSPDGSRSSRGRFVKE
ncbi:MAG: T9SS type A sorting domain-containing protein [Flavobacteriales bacterium]|nr:T9SS type A sorting domain-containing protein [Flavobacteriales bacterium]MCB9193088.1 T9SS type A sorting domain-containing protein [Flavobacteriales bacterium]